MKVAHIITGLGQGGAEAALFRLVTRPEHPPTLVISMMDEGLFGRQLRAAGVAVAVLGMPRGSLTLLGILRLYTLLRAYRPDVVQTWMYHADLVGGMVARLAGGAKVVWGIRHFNLDPARTSASARWAARLCARLSPWIPSAIVSCAKEAVRVHQALGYAPEKFVVIPNGYDLARFAPDRVGGLVLRRQWGVPDSTPLLGFVARWDPQKDHANLLDALARVVLEGRDFRCVLVGAGMSPENGELASLIARHSLRSRVFLAGPRNDIPAVMNALDLHVLSSAGEAFPNTVGEAMACGTPCVVTDVGDAAMIVGDTGWHVPPQDPRSLAAALIQALDEWKRASTWPGRSALCRERIAREFSIETMAKSYVAAWERVVLGGGPRCTLGG